MSGSRSPSYFLEDKSQPLVNPNPPTLNDRLQTQYLDIPEDDNSVQASTTRTIASCVGQFVNPRQVLSVLRVLKAVTLCFIVLTILADLMYIVFVELFVSREVRKLAGGTRDTVIRLYGIALSLIALGIEVDYSKVVKRFAGLKAFIPRSMLFLLIAVITASHPVNDRNSYQGNQYNKYNNNNDDANSNNDDGGNANNNDDGGGGGSNQYTSMQATTADIPASAVGFQMVCSFVLGFCGLGYFICGLLCLDRFTAKAFLSNQDPRVTTAIPSTGTPMSTPSRPDSV